jgi:uncharacterized coiled-coil protein SlyX
MGMMNGGSFEGRAIPAPPVRPVVPSREAGEFGAVRAEAVAASDVEAIRSELDHRSRATSKMVRMVDRHRQHLDGTEDELAALYRRFQRLVPKVVASAEALSAAMKECQRSERVQGLDELFVDSAAALDELETVSDMLTSQFLWNRSAWQRYCLTITEAQHLRDELPGA